MFTLHAIALLALAGGLIAQRPPFGAIVYLAI